MPKAQNPFLRRPNHPNYHRRASHHDYKKTARYLITILKSPEIQPFSRIEGNPKLVEGAGAPTIVLLQTGIFIEEALLTWLNKFPQIDVVEKCIMPDHIHLCVRVNSDLKNGLSLALAGFMGKVSRLFHNAIPINLRPTAPTPVFAKGFNDKIAYTDNQWKAQIKYVKDNPRRYLLKKYVPDFMLRKWKIKIGEKTFEAKGNVLLLKKPWHIVVKHSRRWNEEESNEYQSASRAQIDNGAVPISPFIHPKEKELRDYAVNEGGAYIRICTNGFAERQSASGIEFDLMVEGRLLLIAPEFYDTWKQELKYVYAQKLNSIAAELCELCNAGFSGTLQII